MRFQKAVGYSGLAYVFLAALSTGCGGDTPEKGLEEMVAAERIERLDERLDELLPRGAELEKLADGFRWAEGPLWAADESALLFSDVPQNIIFKWTAQAGVEIFMNPSGYTGERPRGGEPGSNGLAFDPQGRLAMCEHGDRRVSRLENSGKKTTLADRYQGKRFNSPNDLCFRSNGDFYFTDPPYGLEKGAQDAARELDFQGVFLVRTDGSVELMVSDMTRPNGIALAPDEEKLYVANSDPERAVWMVFDVAGDGELLNGAVLFDATSRVADRKGLPDGLKVDRDGNLFATGPGGVLILTPLGQHLGTIDPGKAVANCAWGDDGSTLYLTATDSLYRIKTATVGAGW